MPTSVVAPQPGTKKKEKSMEAALILIKKHYDNGRGDGRGGYDVAKSDPNGWQTWVQLLLEAYDAGKPLSEVTNTCALLLLDREGKKK